MTTENIFNADQANSSTNQNADSSTNQQPSTNTTTSGYASFTIPTEAVDFIGDGKKYKSVDDALKSVPHAQTHIQTLENELKAAREELQKRKTAEELLEQFKPQVTTQQQTTGVEIDPDALSGIVERVIDKKAQQAQAQANVSIVTSQFTAKYGDKAEQVYNNLAKENGLSVAQMNNLAMSSPTALLKLAGLDTNTKPVGGRITSDVVIPTNNNSTQFNTVIKRGATTKDVIDAYKAAEQKVLAQLKT